MYLLFDIGGTNTRVALSKDCESFGEPVIYPTSQDPEQAIAEFVEAAQKLANGIEIKSVVGSIPGVIDPDSGKLYSASNIENWMYKPIPQLFSKALGVPVYMEHDTDIIGLGEAYHGAGAPQGRMAYITISTGVGGSLIVDGKLQKARYNPEPGMQNIYADGVKSKEGNAYDIWEYFISGTALEKRFEKPAAEIDDPAVWDQIARFVALGLHNTIMHWAPEIIVIGGSVMKSLSIDIITKHLEETSDIYPEQPELRAATLGDLGGLYGAMVYSKQLQK